MCVDYWLMANGKKGELTDIYNFESPKFTLMIAFPQLMVQMIEIGCAKRQKMCQAEFCIFALRYT